MVLTVRDFYVGAVAPLTPGAMIKSTAHLDHVYHPRTDAVQAEVCLCSRHVLLRSKKQTNTLLAISCQFVCSLLSHKGSDSGNILTGSIGKLINGIPREKVCCTMECGQSSWNSCGQSEGSFNGAGYIITCLFIRPQVKLWQKIIPEQVLYLI